MTYNVYGGTLNPTLLYFYFYFCYTFISNAISLLLISSYLPF